MTIERYIPPPPQPEAWYSFLFAIPTTVIHYASLVFNTLKSPFSFRGAAFVYVGGLFFLICVLVCICAKRAKPDPSPTSKLKMKKSSYRTLYQDPEHES